MALSPEQRKKAHEAGLQAKAEREAREEMAAKFGNGSDYARFRSAGFTHEEAIERVEMRKKGTERYAERERELRQKIQSYGSGDQIFRGPRGGRYRINSNGRKSYDVP